MADLLIVWHSRTGAAEAMARAAADGARDECSVALKWAADAGPEDLLAADGYIFAAPENLAAISGLMKEFFDRCYYPVLGRIEGRPYAQLVAAGSDGENAARQTARIATGWRLKGSPAAGHHLHTRADAGRNPQPKDDPGTRPRTLPRPRKSDGRRAGDGGVLNRSPYPARSANFPVTPA